jgi:hypothetical protein
MDAMTWILRRTVLFTDQVVRVVHRPGGEKSSIGAKFCSPRPRTEGAAELAMLA